MDDYIEQLFRCLCWWITVQMRLEVHEDLANAERVEIRNPAWARFLRRRARKKARIAEVWSLGDKALYALPKGVVDD